MIRRGIMEWGDRHPAAVTGLALPPGEARAAPSAKPRRPGGFWVLSALLHGAVLASLTFIVTRPLMPAGPDQQVVELVFEEPPVAPPETSPAQPATAASPSTTVPPVAMPAADESPAAATQEAPAPEPAAVAPEPVPAAVPPSPTETTAAPPPPVAPPAAEVAPPEAISPPTEPVAVAPPVEPEPRRTQPAETTAHVVPPREPPPRVRPTRTAIRPTARPEAPMPDRKEAPVAVAPAAPTPAGAAPVAPTPASMASIVDPHWRASLFSWLQSRKVYPDEARRRGEEGRVGVRFTIERSGRVVDAIVVSASGYALLDQAALALLRQAQVPAFPANMTQASIAVSTTIQYSLR